MKNLYPLTAILLVCVLISPHLGKTQYTRLTEQLNGERITGTVDIYYKGHGIAKVTGQYVESQSSFNYISTATTLYLSPFAGKLSFMEDYKDVFKAPPGTTIQQIGTKLHKDTIIDAVATIYKESLDALVLLNNGMVYRVTTDSKGHEYSYIGTTGSQSWEKIKGDDVYALSTSHLYVSKDSSAPWVVDSAGLNGAHVADFDIDSLQNLFAATDKGLFKQDSGTVTLVHVDSYTSSQNISHVFIDRTKRIFIAAGSGVYVSTDNAASWHADTSGIGYKIPKLFADDAFGNVYIAISTQDGDRLYRSNGTGPWKICDTSIYKQAATAVIFTALSGDTVLVAGTTFGIFKSIDTGKTWIANNRGITVESIWGLAKVQNKLLLSTGLGIYAKQNPDTAWGKIYPQSGFTANLPLFDDGLGTVYTINGLIKTGNNYGEGCVLKSTDGGATWATDTIGLTGITGGVFFVDEKGTQHLGSGFYGSGSPDYLSRFWSKPKNGDWAIDTAGFPVAYYSSTSGITSDKNGYLYATGNLSGNSVIRRPINGGEWIADAASPSVTFYSNKFKGNHGDVIGATYDQLYHRGTGTWDELPLPAGSLYPSINAISIDKSGYIFVALDALDSSGVYFTNDLGATWKYAGLPDANVRDLVSYDDTTYVLTTNSGVYSLTHNSALPVTLSSIKAYQFGKGIQVQWSGYNEVNMKGYGVERSTNGNQFTSLGSVVARANGAVGNTYKYFDAAPLNGDNFYRVKALCKDGSVQYSAVVKVSLDNGRAGMLIYPNPVQNKILNIQLNGIAMGKYSLSIYNMAGQRLYAETINHPGGNGAVAVNLYGSAKGTYRVVLTGASHSYSKAILIQ